MGKRRFVASVTTGAVVVPVRLHVKLVTSRVGTTADQDYLQPVRDFWAQVERRYSVEKHTIY